jgi:hypothetical protein
LVSWLEEEIHHHEAKEEPVVKRNTWDSRPRQWLFCEPMNEVGFNHSSRVVKKSDNQSNCLIEF